MGPLPSVDNLVLSEGISAVEALSTLVALEAEAIGGQRVLMYFLVGFERRHLNEVSPTHLTGVRTLTCVTTHVADQIIFIVEALPA